MENRQLVTRPAAAVAEYLPPLTASGVQEQVNLIQTVMAQVMEGPTKDNPTGVHYGVVPGTRGKPSLYKAGAEKLSLVFRLRPIMSDAADIDVIDMGNGHREYRVRCHILDQFGRELATGVGSCSTMESKYRYRRGSDFEVQDCEIPADYRDQKDKYRKEGFGAKQVEGAWKWVKYSTEGRSENPDIADTYNTVLKMAKKRAYVDGILSSTAASDIFTQDVEDLPAEMLGGATARPAQAPAQPKAASTEDKPQEPRRASSEPASVEKSLTGKVAKKYKPRGNSKYFSWTLEGHTSEYLQSMDDAIIEQMDEAGRNGAAVTVHYLESVNGKYTNRVISAVEAVAEAEQADPDGTAQEPEEPQVGD